MSDIKRGPEILRERGLRGPRGEHGAVGPAGPTGATGSDGPAGPSSRGLVKFSGSIEAGTFILADTGTPLAGTPFPGYPVSTASVLRNLAANIGGFVVPSGTITFEVLVNGSPVTGYALVYAAGDSGVKSLTFGPVALAADDTFALAVAPVGVSFSSAIPVSAVLEIATT